VESLTDKRKYSRRILRGEYLTCLFLAWAYIAVPLARPSYVDDVGLAQWALRRLLSS